MRSKVTKKSLFVQPFHTTFTWIRDVHANKNSSKKQKTLGKKPVEDQMYTLYTKIQCLHSLQTETVRKSKRDQIKQDITVNSDRHTHTHTHTHTN